MSEEETNFSDDEINPQAHKKLLQNIGKLGKTQYIKKPTRTELSLKQDEFHLVKTISDETENLPNSSVSVNDLVKLLKTSSKHLKIGKDLHKSQQLKKVLKKPLEKPVAERIHRTIGYEKTKKNVGRWDAVITKNRISDHQVFPLDYVQQHRDEKLTKKPAGPTIKSELMLEMEAFEEKLRELKGKQREEPTDELVLQERLTREELHARRKELAYHRIRESQKSAKARLQNKIKSKKFHKIMKREKLKEQMKEFELLQKSNPEAALEKLDQLEMRRVQERANLRHKNTGTWAKNLQIRAKYDKDVRKDLADQLAISRELTQKQKDEDDEDSDNGDVNKDDEDDRNDPFNPWIKNNKKDEKGNEVTSFVSGYRKYWLERNQNEDALNEYKNGNVDTKEEEEEGNEQRDQENVNEEMKEDRSVDGRKENSNSEDEESMSENELEKFTSMLKQIKDQKSDEEVSDTKVEETDEEINGDDSSDDEDMEKDESVVENEKFTALQHKRMSKHQKKSNTKSPKNKKTKTIESGWEIEDCTEQIIPGPISVIKKSSKNIDDLFDEAEDYVGEKVSKKLKKLSEILNRKFDEKPQNIKHNKNKKKSFNDLSFKKQATRPEIDEELLETPFEKDSEMNSLKISTKKPTLNGFNENKKDDIELNESIDPNKFANIKPKSLKASLPDMVNSEEFFDNENDIQNDKQMTIAEAFEDDDIVADFQKERDNERNQNSNEEVDLTLPGWGSWAGCGISKEKQTKRLILKFPSKEKRRDDNKVNVFIKENANEKLKEHMVSDLPFPFTKVQDFEASIRAPIGRSFVPETAFRLLTKPAVITKMGKIIEPMDESVLIKKPKKNTKQKFIK